MNTFFSSGIIISLISGLLTLIIGFLANETFINIIRRILNKNPEMMRQTYSERLSKLMDNLIKASSEVDSILIELSSVTKERTKGIARLDNEVKGLEENEKQLQQRISDLNNIPIPVAEHFASIVAQSEKRSAWRDYFLFGLGVIVTTVIAIIIKYSGLG
jgi:hypothetical protein